MLYINLFFKIKVIALGGHKSIGDVTDATAATDTIFKLAAIFDATNIFSVQEESKFNFLNFRISLCLLHIN